MGGYYISLLLQAWISSSINYLFGYVRIKGCYSLFIASRALTNCIDTNAATSCVLKRIMFNITATDYILSMFQSAAYFLLEVTTNLTTMCRAECEDTAWPVVLHL